MNYKVIVRSKNTGRQYKKWVYTTKDKFEKYSPEIINRYKNYPYRTYMKDAPFDIEIYHMIHEELVQIV